MTFEEVQAEVARLKTENADLERKAQEKAAAEGRKSARQARRFERAWDNFRTDVQVQQYRATAAEGRASVFVRR